MLKLRIAGMLALIVIAAPALAVDGTTLINQSAAVAAGGFPYKITAPGSYKLSGNLVVSTAISAIEIHADDVTLDLNGFLISGPYSNGGVADPYYGSVAIDIGGATNVSIRGGSIKKWGTGVFATGCRTCRVQDMTIHDVMSGIYLLGNNLGVSITGNTITGSGNGNGNCIYNLGSAADISHNMVASCGVGISADSNPTGGFVYSAIIGNRVLGGGIVMRGGRINVFDNVVAGGIVGSFGVADCVLLIGNTATSYTVAGCSIQHNNDNGT